MLSAPFISALFPCIIPAFFTSNSSIYYFRNICVYISVFPPSIISVIFASKHPSFPRPFSSMCSVYSFCCISVVLPSIISVSSEFLYYFRLFLRVICVHISVLFPPVRIISATIPFVPYYLCLYFRNDFRLPCPYYFRIICVYIISAFFASILPYLSAQFPYILFVTFASTSLYGFRPLFPYYLCQCFRRLFPPILSVLFPSYVRLLSQRCVEPPVQPDLMRGDIDRQHTLKCL